MSINYNMLLLYTHLVYIGYANNLIVVVIFLNFQCKITVPKMGSVQDLCAAVAGLLKVAHDKVKYVFIFCVILQ